MNFLKPTHQEESKVTSPNKMNMVPLDDVIPKFLRDQSWEYNDFAGYIC